MCDSPNKVLHTDYVECLGDRPEWGDLGLQTPCAMLAGVLRILTAPVDLSSQQTFGSSRPNRL